LLDKIGFFAAASGMELNIKKTFYVLMEFLKDKAPLCIPMPVFDKHRYDTTGQYRYIKPIPKPSIQEEDVHHEWRHLGNYQSNAGSSKELSSQLHTIIGKNLKYVCSKKLSADGGLQGYSLKILLQLLYKTKHGNLTYAELQKVQRAINKKLKHALKVARTIPDDLLFGHPIAGGLSLPHIWDETNIEKALILQASLMDNTLDIYHVMQGGILRMRQKCCSLIIPLSSPWDGLRSLDDAAWLTTLWQWMTAQNVTISVPLDPPESVFENDICILDHYVNHHTSQLTENDLNILRRTAKG